jgi:hypothetical protein
MMSRLRLAAFVCLVLAAAGTHASAQDPGETPEGGRFRLGPLRFTPSIAITNVGVDDNVFNEDLDPKRDTTAALGPAVNLWMNLGRARLSGKASGQYLYFSQYQNQRAWNTIDEGKLEVPLRHLRPFVGFTYANTKERPGFEIDSRAHALADAVIVGTEVKLSSRTSVVLTGSRSRLEFDEGETFLGANLASALNRTTDSEAVQFRLRLTSLTTFVAGAEALQDRFAFEPIRNADSLKVLPGFEIRPSALVSGKVFVGFRRFDGSDAALPDYQGPIAAVDATYISGATRLAVKVNRDLSYSYQPTQPYYALTDVGVVLTERLARSWDVVGRAGRQLLDYRQLQSAQASSERTDTILQYGGGVGYRLGQTFRVGFDAIHYRRESKQVLSRGYEGLRFGASISYGLPQ